jgi:hypothetical protein
MNAYSEDLRMKIVEALGRGRGKSEAARGFFQHAGYRLTGQLL